jgi:hypothetical protein
LKIDDKRKDNKRIALTVLGLCPLVLVVKVGWMQATEMTSEEGKVWGSGLSMQK